MYPYGDIFIRLSSRLSSPLARAVALFIVSLLHFLLSYKPRFNRKGKFFCDLICVIRKLLEELLRFLVSVRNASQSCSPKVRTLALETHTHCFGKFAYFAAAMLKEFGAKSDALRAHIL